MEENPISEKKKRQGPKKASEKCMDYLARRDHSELELRTKLQRSQNYSAQEIEQGIAWVKEHGWLPDPQELAERTAAMLHGKLRGHLYISNYLRQKGLPSVDKDPELELNKARDWAESKYGPSITKNDRVRLIRQLRSRGFDEDTLRKVFYEER